MAQFATYYSIKSRKNTGKHLDNAQTLYFINIKGIDVSMSPTEQGYRTAYSILARFVSAQLAHTTKKPTQLAHNTIKQPKDTRIKSSLNDRLKPIRSDNATTKQK